MSEAIKNRYEFIILFDVENGNPNGDPDSANMPRVDPETNQGIVTDVCLKKKIRKYVETVKEYAPGYAIYIRDDAPLNSKDQEAVIAIGANSEDLKKAAKDDENFVIKIRDFMCKNYFDIRTFGAVMTTFVSAKLNCGQVCGPVQLGFARSIDPIIQQDITPPKQPKVTLIKKALTPWAKNSLFPMRFTVFTDIFPQILRAKPPVSPTKTLSFCGMLS